MPNLSDLKTDSVVVQVVDPGEGVRGGDAASGGRRQVRGVGSKAVGDVQCESRRAVY